MVQLHGSLTTPTTKTSDDRSLRILTRDYKRRKSRRELDLISGRARPRVWAEYALASIAVKCVTRNAPVNLKQMILRNTYYERRRPGRIKFFDGSRRKIGIQTIENRLTKFFFIETEIHEDALRVGLKNFLGMNLNLNTP